ncbi:heterokaryon incompatibility protein-domain-containing protein [Leptodontidium sp. MPI-SDFR-AT-0119]|nr:heterokaryon incompatibility protein-domain-containing protein [Leptodontidium sp. MPI-SDFR-AT-0119]
MPGDFQYTSLKNPESDLRLIQIASGQHGDDLKCTITVHSKHSLKRTKYNALSYTWGDVAVKVPISLNGRICFVTPNLEGALRNLRCLTPAERGKQLPLWVDAICINQNDREERDNQVRRMKDIYQSAEWVTIWLGNYYEPCDDRILINEAKWGIENPGRGSEMDTAEATRLALCLGYMLDDPSKDQTFLDGTKTYPPEVENIKAWVQLSRLFQRAWFERLWVIQEISVSQRAMVLCGKYMILWPQLEKAAKYILRPRGIPVPPRIQKILPLMGAHRMTQVSIKSMWNVDEKNILTILHTTQDTKCLDPRDRLYAILGIIEDKEDVEIDYSIPVEQVYRNWAEKRIRRTNTLDILSACADSSRLGDLPSWVPDLRRPFGQDKPLWIFDHTARKKDFPSLQTYTRHFLQSDGKCRGLQISQDGLTLSVHGYQAGVIRHLSIIGDVVSNLQDPTDLTTRLRSVLNEWKDTILKLYGPGFRFADVVLRTSEPWDLLPVPLAELTLNAWMENSVYDGSQDIREFERLLFPRVHGCQIFLTSRLNGGAVPGDCQAQVGDEIWILSGGLTPFILRRLGPTMHRLISPCYLYGSMGYFVRKQDTTEELRTVTLV